MESADTSLEAPRRRRQRRRTTGVTVVEVARKAGVSTATVSRVLNGIPTVDAELVARVQDAILRTGYVLNGAGRALRRQRSDTWAAIVPDILNPFFVTLVAALEDVAAEHGFSVVLCNTDKRIEREREYVATAIRHQMAGVVMAPTSPVRFDIEPLRSSGTPLVFVDRMPDVEGVDAVMMENTEAGRIVARHLLSEGYRRPGCLVGRADLTTTEDRLDGFREVFAAAGIAVTEDQIRRTDLREDGAEVATRSLLAAAEPPDCIFAANGPSTVGAFRAIQGLGLRLPDNVGLAGTDDDVWTRMVTPAITVVQQPVRKMGRLAAQLLLARSEGTTTPTDHIVLQPTLIPRPSTVRA